MDSFNWLNLQSTQYGEKSKVILTVITCLHRSSLQSIERSLLNYLNIYLQLTTKFWWWTHGEQQLQFKKSIFAWFLEIWPFYFAELFPVIFTLWWKIEDDTLINARFFDTMIFDRHLTISQEKLFFYSVRDILKILSDDIWRRKFNKKMGQNNI